MAFFNPCGLSQAGLNTEDFATGWLDLPLFHGGVRAMVDAFREINDPYGDGKR
ncbi:hypothetical protein G3435_06600 [Pseudomonas sp. MAFF212428]|uniref:Uncharacterized protein n=1 Tax=Pseudomonas brassicae TaxID=2708063 RepID=A0A6B3NV03_9PSED|nr:hypothetical protein [Pseudomonas brassicae]NER59745.1 hypothetical protein [Pseudomonas brassicae]NER65623.1 hypothetical protein [Pseudomonas brassicae]